MELPTPTMTPQERLLQELQLTAESVIAARKMDDIV